MRRLQRGGFAAWTVVFSAALCSSVDADGTAAAASTCGGGDGAVLTTTALCVAVDGAGAVTAVVDRALGRSFAPAGAAVGFIALVPAGSASPSAGQSVVVSQKGGPNTPIHARVVPSAGGGGAGLNVTMSVTTVALGSGPPALVLEVTEMSADPGLAPVGALQFARVGVAVGGAAQNLVAAYTADGDDRDFAVALVPVSLPVDVTAAADGPNATKLAAALPLATVPAPVAPASAAAASPPRVGPLYPADGARVALWGGPRSGLAAGVRAMEKAFGLPSPTIGGVPAKASPETRRGYFLIDVNETTLDVAIGYARASGIDYITLLWESWAASCGHYNESSANWPSGLRAAVRKIHASGLKAGMHTLSGNINFDDAYVTPVPDPRLATVATLTLAGDVAAERETAFVPVVENTSALPNPYGVLVADIGQDVLVGEEIMTYARVNASKRPFGLNGVERGQYGTRVAAHAAGAAVKKLAAHRADGAFLPSVAPGDQSLIEAIGARLAEVFDTYEFDMIYFDGLQSIGALGPIHYTAPLVQRAFSRAVMRDAIVESSDMHPFNWHLNTRAGQTDWAATDPRAFMDYTKAASERATAEMLVPCDMGWWGYETHSDAFYATTPDEIEYMASRAVGWGANPNLETSIASLQGNGRTKEALALVRPWTLLTLDGAGGGAVRALLREPDTDFNLLVDSGGGGGGGGGSGGRHKRGGTSSNGTGTSTNSGKGSSSRLNRGLPAPPPARAWIRPAKAHPVTVAESCTDAAPCAWSVPRAFAGSPGPFGVRIRALTAVDAGDGANTRDLLQLRSRTVVRTTTCKGDISSIPIPHSGYDESHTAGSATTSGKGGGDAGPKVNATVRASPTGNLSLMLNYTAPSEGDVGCFRQRFAPATVNLTSHRPVRLSVYGDGSGATLCAQLEDDKAPFFRAFFVNVTWVGWRTVRLDVAATRELFLYPQLPMPANPNMAMRSFDYAHVLALNLYVTGVRRACLYVGEIDALPESEALISAVSLRLGGAAPPASLELATRLGSSPPDYVECDDAGNMSSCRAFDANGFALPGGLLPSAVRDVKTTPEGGGAGDGAGAGDGDGEVTVTLSVKGDARAEVRLFERSSERMGPFPLLQPAG